MSRQNRHGPWLAGLVSVMAMLPGCSVFGVRTAPEPDYTVTHQVDSEPIEVRRYEETLVATTQVRADSYDKASRVGFRRLADYIFGENRSDEEIGMTAPVFQRMEPREGEEIGMTAPVLQSQEREGVWRMSFVMPARYTRQTLPEPMDPAIEIESLPAREVAVIRFRGRLRPENVEEAAEELRRWIQQSPYQATSAPRAAGYDPPYTLPPLRRNEVLIEVERDSS